DRSGAPTRAPPGPELAPGIRPPPRLRSRPRGTQPMPAPSRRLEPLLIAALSLAALLLAPTDARAEFRGDEVGPGEIDFNDEYFLNLYSYRPRLTHRWAWGNAASTRW